MVPDPSDDPVPPPAFTRTRFDLARGRVVGDEEVPPLVVDGGDGEAVDPRVRDEALLALYAGMLRDALVAALPGWIERCVQQRAAAAEFDEASARAVAVQAGEQAVADVGPRLARLLGSDPDHQSTTPLELLRQATVHATAALRTLGVPPQRRDAGDVALHPEDDYALAPASFADVDPALAEVGLRWGAAKAHVHLRRRGEAAGPS